MIGGRKGRPYRGSARVQNRPVRVSINPIVLEVFIHPHIELSPVAVIGAVENPAVNHGHAARQIEGGGGSTRPRKNLRRRLRNRRRGGAGSRIAGQDLSPQSIGEVLLGPSRKLRIFVGRYAVPGRRR